MKKITLLISLLLLLFTSACAQSPTDSKSSATQPSYPGSYSSDSNLPSETRSADPSYPSDSGNTGKPVQTLLPPAQSVDPNNPYAPLPGDEALLRDKVYPETTEVRVMESFPPQFMLALRGSLPTPCHFLRVQINPADKKNNIYVEVYSVSDPNMVCAQVLQSFEASVPLKDLIPGHYIVWVNGEKITEIDA